MKPITPAPAPATPAEPTRAAVRERRRSTRIDTLTAGKLTPLPRPADNSQRATGNCLRVQVFDVSLHGVGFRTAHRLTPGATYDIEIGNGPMYLTAAIRITRIRPRPDGTFDTGADFI